MGFLKTIETASGVVVQDAYHRIETILGDKNTLECTMGVYASKQAFDDGKVMISVVNVVFTPQSDDVSLNVFKQAYASIFASPDYSDVTHVLEDGQEPL